jgi:hypothetical protein
MTLRELIDELSDLADTHGDDTEIRLAHQPRWAFEYSIQRDTPVAAVTVRNDDGERQTVIYIAEGAQLGYLPQSAAVAVGWSEEREDDEDNDDGLSAEGGGDECAQGRTPQGG